MRNLSLVGLAVGIAAGVGGPAATASAQGNPTASLSSATAPYT